MSLLKHFKTLLSMYGLIPHKFFGGGPPAAPSNTSSSSNSTSTPWGPAGQALDNTNSNYNTTTGLYENNGNGPTGTYQNLNNFVNQYGTLNPQQQATIAGQAQNLNQQAAWLRNVTDASFNAGNQQAGGQWNTHFGPVADAATQQSNFGQAVDNSGASAANQQLLSGNVNMPVVGAMSQANINAANQQYNRNLTALAQTALPQISNDAFAAGQYGGSRQGIAQGIAINGVVNANQTLAQSNLDAGNNMYGNAYNTAQGLMGQTANNLTNQSVQNSQFNATAGNNQNQFNANLGIANNNQQINQNNQNISNINAGNANNAAALTNMMVNGNANYNAQMNLLQTPQQQAQNALNLQLGAYGAGAGIGGSATSTSTQPIYNNTVGQTAGLLTAGAGIYSAFK